MKQDFIRPVYSDDFVAVIVNKSLDFRPNQLKKKRPGGHVKVTALGKGQLKG